MGVYDLRGDQRCVVFRARPEIGEPADGDEQENNGGGGEPAPGNVSRGNYRRPGGLNFVEDFLAQFGWRLFVELRALQRRVKRFLFFESGDTVVALLEMALEFSGAQSVQFVVEIGVNDGASLFTSHEQPLGARDLRARFEVGGARAKARTSPCRWVLR